MAHLERLTPGVARVEVVPVADVGLAVDPAQVDLASVAQRGEVDEPAVEVAQDDPARVELRDAGLPRGAPPPCGATTAPPPCLRGPPPPFVGAAPDSAARACSSVSSSRAS